MKTFHLVQFSIVLAASALAHDSGFGHSKRTLLWSATKSGLTLEYRIRLPGDQVILEAVKIDADGDGTVSPAEKDLYFRKRGQEIGNLLRVTESTGIRVAPKLADFRLGHSFTQTYRFDYVTNADSVELSDGNFRDKPGSVKILKSTGVVVSIAEQTDLLHVEGLRLVIRKVSER